MRIRSMGASSHKARANAKRAATTLIDPSRALHLRAFLLPLFALALGSGAAAAQPAQNRIAPSLNLRGFAASTDPASGVYYEPAASPAHLEANASAWLSYA